jgi:putative membrane protein
MRWVNLAVIVIFAAALLIFAAQNLQTVTVYFLRFQMSGAPHAVLIVIIYILGRVTGGGLGTLVRQAFEGARSA